MRKHIEEVLSMTQVGQMLMDRGRKEGMQEGRKEGRREGNITALYDLYNDGDITLHKAAAKAGMYESDFLETAKRIVKS